VGGGFSIVGGGQFMGPSPTPMGSGVARVLGLQGGELPGVPAAGGTVQSVFVVGDTSDQVSRALVPRRFWGANRHTFAAPNVLFLSFRSGPAPSIIERFRLAGDVAAAPLVLAVGVGISPGAGFIGLVPPLVAQGAIEVGGQVPFSTNFLGWGPQTSIGPSLGFGSIFVTPQFLNADVLRNWYVGAGASLNFQTNDPGVDAAWEIQWRELPE